MDIAMRVPSRANPSTDVEVLRGKTPHAGVIGFVLIALVLRAAFIEFESIDHLGKRFGFDSLLRPQQTLGFIVRARRGNHLGLDANGIAETVQEGSQILQPDRVHAVRRTLRLAEIIRAIFLQLQELSLPFRQMPFSVRDTAA